MRHWITGLVLLLALGLLAAGCGDDGGDADPVADPDPADDSAADEDGTGDDGAGDAADDGSDAPPAVDFEVFESDEGAGCAVYVSVPEDAIGDDHRLLIWQGVVAQGFTTCGFSEVVEVGLLTVNGLDSYNQPDFSQTIEHSYFQVSGWDALVADCYTTDLGDACAAQLQAALTE
ncbi:MAG: hypothetical protein R8F63_19225 [Acidimicrobiales bacterium]|nr:hypothetical protein [Acidimicrobiales bacterium]